MMTASLPIVGKSRAGFTLLELIGVMVVIALLLTTAIPGVIDLIRVQRVVNEGAELPRIASALELGILREQAFPIYNNDAMAPSKGNTSYWWNLAARHGGGSANQVRYPLGVRPGTETTRKLYFAEVSWAGRTFFEIVGDGHNWLANPADPKELRLLLVSTTNPDLSLPDELSLSQFNRFWDDWNVGPGGNPASGVNTWSDYGLNSLEWSGRAPELNMERIDLRDWLCALVIENRRSIQADSGTAIDDSSPNYTGTQLLDDWDLHSIYAYPENQVGAEVIVRLREITKSGIRYSQVTGIDLAKRGLVVDETAKVSLQIRGSKSVISADSGEVVTTPVQGGVELELTDRAPIAMLNPNDSANPLFLSGWENSDPYIQNRYYLPAQELLLCEPWSQSKVGIFIITKPFDILRFDGLRWHY